MFRLSLITALLGVVYASENIIRFHLVEELPVGTLVGNIGVESNIKANFTEAEWSNFQYSYLDQTEMRKLFTIDEKSGNLFIRNIIDRESQCIFLDQCIFTFDVAIHSSSPQLFEIFTIQITIEDRNDNSPAFSTESMDLHILESTLPGTMFGVDEAIDLDSTQKNTIQTYELVEGGDIFQLNVTKDLDERFGLKLILLTQLDRENTQTYKLKILATDGGDPKKTGTLDVNIIVDDVNDNAPIFERDAYAISIKEGLSQGTPILSVTAYDQDIGDNGKVVYRFNPRQFNIDRISQMFAINEETGVVYVSSDVIYGKENVYKIDVEASDKGSQQNTAHVPVTITVIDTVNNEPDIRINFLISANDSFASLSEGVDVGTVIAHVTVIDADSGSNGQVICAVTNDFVTLQNISGKPGYLIVLTKEFDRETKQEHYISITCSDHGTPKLSTSQSFIIQVLDENDNEPVFTQKTYSTVIEENPEAGKFCLRVSASDKDVWPHDDVRYSLTGNVANLFSINSATGVITTSGKLDRETQDEYKFTVLAIDSGTKQLTGTTLVAIFLKDVNDNKPEFDVPFFQFFVRENLPPETLVGTVNAHDSDIGLNKKLEFSLVQNPGEEWPFTVTSEGHIKSTISFDREQDTDFIFEIVATDSGLPPLSSKIFVRVYITDENDNSPIIRYPNILNNTVTVSYTPVAGSYITIVQAEDADEKGPNSLLSFDIVSGNEEDMFSIGKTSGKIFLKKPKEDVLNIKTSLTVRVSDNGSPKLNTTHTFYLAMEYVDSTSISSIIPRNPDNKNVIISIAVVSMTLIISGALIAVICILRRSEQIRKKLIEDHEKQKCHIPKSIPEPEIKQKYDMNLKENMSYPEHVPEKEKQIYSSYDEDLDNMELYNSFGTSVFTDTLPGLEKPGQSMEDQRIIKRSSLKHVLSDGQISGIQSLDDISEISEEGCGNSDSGRGSSDPDTTRSTNFYYDRRGSQKPKAELKERLPKPKHIEDTYEQKFYGFVDRPAIPNTDQYPNDLKIVRFNEQGQFCIDTSSFV